MKEFTRLDLEKKLGKSRGSSLFVSFRKDNLGVEKMMSCISKNRYGSHETLKAMFVFDKNEIVRNYILKIRRAELNPFNNLPSHILSSWRKSIRDIRGI